MTWPTADFDDLRRLHVLQQSLSGTFIAETVLAQPFERIWPVLDDIEVAFPELLPDIRSMRVLERGGERIRATAHGRSGLRAAFEIVMRPGWCVMRSRFLVFGMAAVPDGANTRFGYFTGLRLPGKRWYGALLSPFHRRLAAATLRRFERKFGRASPL